MRHLLSSILTKVGHLEAPKKETKVAGDSPAKHKYVRLDSYVPNKEIVSRKYTQLSEVSEETAIRYLKKLTDKYAPSLIIAEVSSNMSSTMPVSSKGRREEGKNASWTDDSRQQRKGNKYLITNS